MPKMSELDLTVKELRAAAQALIGAADSLTALFSGADGTDAANPVTAVPDAASPPERSEKKPEPPKPAVTLEQVRGILAEKSRNGHTGEVRALLEKHGAGKLSDISPDRYAELLKDAEGLA